MGGVVASEGPPSSDAPQAASRTDDPGKQSRLALGIPVVPAFDGFRAIAVLGVVLVHVFIISGLLPLANDDPVGLLAWGTVGQILDMLFIISGFVIFLPTVAKGGQFGSIRAFAIRRSARLLPAYWAVLTIILVLIASVQVTPEIPFPPLPEIALNFTFLEVPAEFFRNEFFLGFGVDRAIWTLWSEVCFYALLPFVAAWFFRHPFVGLAIAGAVTAGWKLLFNNISVVASWFGVDVSPAEVLDLTNAADIQFPAWFFSIALGMTAAWLYVYLRAQYDVQLLRRMALRALLGLVPALALFVYLAGDASTEAPFLTAPEYARHSVVVSLGYSASLAATMLAVALAPLPVQRPFSGAATRWVADYSVGMYLFHLVAITYLASMLSIPQDGSLGAVLIWCALVFPITIAYGWLSGRFLEQPVRRSAQVYARRASARSREPSS